MKKPKISVIVPIYNTKNYLVKCIESILNQRYEELEVILVDDGSTDGSEYIIDKYSREDSRVIAFHKMNGGEASARNFGLSKATGDYIGFVDSDDWIEKEMYQTLVEAMGDNELDMVIGGYFIDYGTRVDTVVNLEAVTGEVFGMQQLLRYVFERDAYKAVTAYSWNKLYRREMLLRNQKYVEYDERYRIGTDVLWFAQVGVFSERNKIVEVPLYHYMQREGSAVHSQDLEKQKHRIEVYERVIDLFVKNDVDKDTIDFVKRFLAYHAMNIAKMAQTQNNIRVYEEMCLLMRKYENEYVNKNTQYPDRVTEYKRIINGDRTE